jgi:2-pyrone-4,6-dicarboxylate lactonase
MTSTFEPDADWLGYLPGPRKPLYKLPPGSVDAHCHVFGPGDVFPYAPERKYTPTGAPKEQPFALHDFLGFDRSVIVQATCHGADNRALVDALRAAGGKSRGVATIRPGVTRDELADLFTHLPTAIVVDHMGRPDVTRPLDGPGFTLFCKFMHEHENVWAKLSGAERLTKSGPPGYDDVVPFARHLARTFPDRVIWGTDWPHPNMKSFMPDEGDQVDLIPRIAPTEDLQRKLLVDNPVRLYWPKDER